MDEKKKRGRPVKNGPRKWRLAVRMNEKEIEMLDYVASKTKMSRTAVIVKGVRTLYNLEKYRE